MANPIVFFEIGGTDRARAAAFYGELFEWTLTPTEHATVIATGDEAISGHLVSLEVEPHTLFYVGVDDVDDALARAVELGGRALVGPISLPTGRFAWFADLDGNTIGLWQNAV